MLLLGMIHHMIIIHQNPVLPTIPLLQHSPSHYHYAPQRSRLVFASQARCHVHVLHASCGKCPTTPLLKHSTLLNNTIIEIWLLFTQTRCYQPYLPCNILHLSISKYLYNQWWRPMCDVFVQFVFISDPGPLSAVWSFPPHLHLMVTTHHDQYSARSRCLSPCPPYQLLEVSQHTSTSW